jgi:Spy/CpxP family protein refolding chaperone
MIRTFKAALTQNILTQNILTQNILTQRLAILCAGTALIVAPIISSGLNQGAIAAPQMENIETIAREMGGMTPEKMEERLQKLAQELKLTPEQTTQIRALRQRSRAQLDGIVTQQQRDTMKATLKSGKGLKAAMEAAQITPTQREAMKKVRQETKASMDQILTTEQKAQLKSKMQELRQKQRGQRRAG